MKTDVLLTYAPNHQGLCSIKGGFADGEYVRYYESNTNRPVLLTLGGSTTTGFFQHISNGDTYPSYLARYFKNEYQVLNGGVGAYSSLQELYKVIRDAPRINNLHTVISLNGINDIPDYNGLNKQRRLDYPFLTELQFRINEQQFWIDQRGGITLQSILPNLTSLFIFFHRKSHNKVVSKSSTLTNSLPIDAAERWLINVKRMYAILKEQGVRYIVFLQPTLGLDGIQSLPAKGSSDALIFNSLPQSYLNVIRDLYSDLKKYCLSLSYCIDISDAVPPTGNVYNDARHHNSTGNKLLSKVIEKKIRILDEKSNKNDFKRKKVVYLVLASLAGQS